MTTEADFVMERYFAAPPALVWKAWVTPDLLARWYGPGVETVLHKFEPVPGGEWLNEMRMGERSMFSRAVFREVVPAQRLVFDLSTTDADWNEIANPMMPDWPRILRSIAEFRPKGAGTEMIFTWRPHEASEAECAAFAAASEKLGGGWGSGFAIIDEIVAELQTA